MAKKKILVVGDIILDIYQHVSYERTCQECPDLNIYDIVETEYRLGGAANVANNIKNLYPDSMVWLAGISGNHLQTIGMVRGVGIDTTFCYGGNTMTKTRYVDYSTKKQLMRIDNFKKFPKVDIDFFSTNIKFGLWEKEFDIVVISDYDKGTLTEEIINHLKKYNNIIVDSKRYDLRLFKGMQILKLNNLEYSQQIGNPLYSSEPVESFFDFCVVTKGKDGAELRFSDKNIYKKHKPSFCSQVSSLYSTNIIQFPVKQIKDNIMKDTVGAGDTSTAGLSVGLLNGLSIEESIDFANECAKNVVEQFGTSVPRFTFNDWNQKRRLTR